MANLTPLQEAMNKAHSEDRSPCLPNCWRSHQGDKAPKHECNWCDQKIDNDSESVISHNEYHMRNPESITK